ncbi:MAG: hypothetical protein HGA78_04055 [Nitrospirales bacterium]|nr:hypothetical protein [Nitrospirales bacterium]
MPKIEIVIAISISFGGIVGYVSRLLAEHFLIRRRKWWEEFDKAKRHFRSLLAHEIAELRTRKHIFKDSSHINSLHAAMIEFQPFLRNKKRVALSKAWVEYQDHEEYRAWTKPEEDGIMPTGPNWAKTEAIKYLENILKFTE